MSEKKSALLTPRQREFLSTDEHDMTARGERSARARIRDRIDAGLDDLGLLAEHPDLDEFVDADDSLASQLRSTVAFVYRAGEMADLDVDELIEEGIVEGRRGHAGVLLKRFRDDPDSLTLGEFRELQLSGKLTRDVYSEVTRGDVRAPIGNVSEDEFGRVLRALDEEAREDDEE